jgi:hypothetical protein
VHATHVKPCGRVSGLSEGRTRLIPAGNTLDARDPRPRTTHMTARRTRAHPRESQRRGDKCARGAQKRQGSHAHLPMRANQHTSARPRKPSAAPHACLGRITATAQDQDTTAERRRRRWQLHARPPRAGGCSAPREPTAGAIASERIAGGRRLNVESTRPTSRSLTILVTKMSTDPFGHFSSCSQPQGCASKCKTRRC